MFSFNSKLSDFSRRMGGLDPMEGPSWLFSDNDVNNGPKHTKSRDEKRKENSLKARLSSASRKLSIEPENEEENRLEEELSLSFGLSQISSQAAVLLLFLLGQVMI